MTTYVNIWAFLTAIIISVVGCTGAFIFYGQQQHTQDLITQLTTSFETKIATIATNNSLLMTSLVADFQAKIATASVQIEALATANGALSAEKTSLWATFNTTQAGYNTLLNRQNNLTTNLNKNWTDFSKAYNKGLKKLSDSKSPLRFGWEKFNASYKEFLLNTTANYTNAIALAQTSKTNFDTSGSLYNASNYAFSTAMIFISDNWVNPLASKYVNATVYAKNMTYEMKQANLALISSSQYFGLGNLTEWRNQRNTMKNHWALYNASYASYNTKLSEIDTLLGTL